MNQLIKRLIALLCALGLIFNTSAVPIPIPLGSSIVYAADPSLVGHWTFDNISGSSVKDETSNHNDGTIKDGGTPATGTIVAGKVGKAIYFDGNNDYVEVPDSNSLDVTDNFTIAFWIKPEDISTKSQSPLNKAYHNGSPYYPRHFTFHVNGGSVSGNLSMSSCKYLN